MTVASLHYVTCTFIVIISPSRRDRYCFGEYCGVAVGGGEGVAVAVVW